MSENLLCPFCGIGKPKTGFTRAYIRAKEEGRDHECKRVATVYCDSCPAQFIECYESEDAALKAWNTRVGTPSPELVELRKDKERLDWLSSKPVDGFIMALTPTATLFDWSSEDSQSLRTAIDAAKEKK